MKNSTTFLSCFLVVLLCFVAPSIQQQRDSESINFRQEVFLKPSTTDLPYELSFVYNFGGAVAIDREGTTLAVGASGDQSRYLGVWPGSGYPVSYPQDCEFRGAAYTFRRDTLGRWKQTAFLKPHFYHQYNAQQFGAKLVIEDDILVVGAKGSDRPVLQTGLPIAEGSIQHATSANFSVDEWATGVWQATGAAFVFVRERNDEEGGEEETWRQEAFLGPPYDSGDSSEFGDLLAITKEKMLVVSMRMEDSSLTGIFNDPQVYADSYNSLSTDSGAVVVYSAEENEAEGAIPKYRWTVEAVLKGAWMDIRDYFGTAVAADGNTIVVSAAGEDSGPLASPIHGVPEGFVPDNNHDACGAVYVFVRDEETGNWTQQAFLKPPTCEGAGFGKGISLLGNVLVVSSDHDVQYVYVRDEVSQEWSFKEQLQPSTKEDGVWQYFGISHSMTSEDLLLVGSPYENSRLTGVNYGDDIPFINNASHAGAAFVFVRNDTNEQSWTQLAMLKASNTRENAEFGRAVAYNKGLFAIGAVLEETNIPGITYGEPTDAGGASRRIGAVYVFSSSFEPCKGSVTAESSSIHFECIGGRWHSFDSVTVRKEETTRRRQEEDVQLLVDSADSIAVDGFLRIVKGATVRMKVGTESRSRKNPVLYLGGCADIFGTLEVEIDPSVTAPTEVTLLRQDPSCVPLEAFNITAAHDYALCSSSFQTSFDESTGHLSVLVHPELLEASSPSCVPVDGSNSGSTSSSSSVPDEAREEGGDDENTVAIVVPSVIGGLLLLLAVVAVVVVALFFVRRKKNEKQRSSVVMLEDLEQGGEQNYAAVSTPSSKKSKDSKMVSRKRGATTSFGLNYNDLEFGEEIGHGSFGVVYQGKWRLTPVAIKLLNQLKEEQLDDFQKEVELMQNIRPHSNVVQLLGVCVDPQYPLCIVTELMPGGSLDAFLKSPKGQQLTHPEMIRIAMGITAGMQHLHSENIIHCDLAARNVLLNKSLDAKVADFGMARVLNAEDEQHQTLANVGPIRWMAPESMKDQVYSAKSDAWSFGVVLFEIASFGELPYEELANLQVSLAVVSEGRRLEPPKDAPKVFVELMSICFATQPEDRPNFTSMHAMLSDALEEM